MIATYALLTLAVVSLWLGGDDRAPKWRRFGWLAVLAAAVAAAMKCGVVHPIGLVWIVALALAAFAFARPALPLWVRLAAAVVILGLSLGLLTHQLPGFANLRVLYAVRFTPDAMPYTLFLNFDKTVVGVLLLGWCHARLSRAAEMRRMLKAAAPWILPVIGVVLVLSLAAGYVRFEPKFPRETWLWLWVNLCFTCLTEEALFRGFVQAQVQRALQHVPAGHWLAIALAAVLFGIVHAGGGATYVALATVAGAGYGWIYLRTGRIEASILAHFTVNTVHFFLFTYPALQ